MEKPKVINGKHKEVPGIDKVQRDEGAFTSIVARNKDLEDLAVQMLHKLMSSTEDLVGTDKDLSIEQGMRLQHEIFMQFIAFLIMRYTKIMNESLAGFLKDQYDKKD